MSQYVPAMTTETKLAGEGLGPNGALLFCLLLDFQGRASFNNLCRAVDDWLDEYGEVTWSNLARWAADVELELSHLLGVVVTVQAEF